MFEAHAILGFSRGSRRGQDQDRSGGFLAFCLFAFAIVCRMKGASVLSVRYVLEGLLGAGGCDAREEVVCCGLDIGSPHVGISL